MRAGLLNRRLRLQQITSVTDADGFVNETWTDLATVWASINPARAIEGLEAAQSQERITHQISIRWRSDVSTRMRFLYSGTVATGTQTGVVYGFATYGRSTYGYVGRGDVFIPRIFLIHTMLDPDEAFRQLDCMCEEFVTAGIGAT